MNLLKNIKSLFSNEKKNRKMPADELAEFKANLIQVIAWTEKLAADFDYDKGKYGLVFRQTNPEFKGNSLYQFKDCYAEWTTYDYTFKDYNYLLRSAINARILDMPTDIDLSKIDELGRILSFETCITTNDGAPSAESRNFVDHSDVPPIDTWFFLKTDYYHDEHKCSQFAYSVGYLKTSKWLCKMQLVWRYLTAIGGLMKMIRKTTIC